MTDLAAQYGKCTQTSPCALRDEEVVLRVYYLPQDKDFEKAVVSSDDINGKNHRTFSVNREKYTKRFQLLELKAIQQKRTPEKRKIAEIVAFADVGQIRGIEINGISQIIAYDDATLSNAQLGLSPNTAHASIRAITELKREQVSEFRVRLRRCEMWREAFDIGIRKYPACNLEWAFNKLRNYFLTAMRWGNTGAG